VVRRQNYFSTENCIFFFWRVEISVSSSSNIGDPFCHHKHSLMLNAEQVSEAPDFCSRRKRLLVRREVIT